jgi:hypothetical protein
MENILQELSDTITLCIYHNDNDATRFKKLAKKHPQILTDNNIFALAEGYLHKPYTANVVRLLVDAGVDKTMQECGTGRTILHTMAIFADYELFSYIVAACTRAERTKLYAAKDSDMQTVEDILNDDDFWYMCGEAAEKDRQRMLRLIIDHELNVFG